MKKVAKPLTKPHTRASGEHVNMIQNLTISNKSEHERALDVTLSGEFVESEYMKELKAVQRTAARPGFRAGKVPLSIVMSAYDAHIKKRLLENLIEKSLQHACKENDLIPVSTPEFENLADLDVKGPFNFRAVFQVRPKVEVLHYENLAIEIPKGAVSDKDIDAQLEILREQHGKFVEPTDGRAITARDLVQTECTVALKGEIKKENCQPDFAIPLFAEGIEAKFVDALVGKNVGDIVKLTHVMPSDHKDPELREQECDLTLEVKSFKERILPTLDDDFAKDLSTELTSLDALKKVIATQLQYSLERRNEFSRRNAITKALVEQNPISIPRAMIEQAAKALIKRELAQMPADQSKALVHDHWPQMWKAAVEQAEFRAHSDLIFEYLIEKLAIVADPKTVAVMMRQGKNVDREDAIYSAQLAALFDWLEKANAITHTENLPN
jgi:trigger factor